MRLLKWAGLASGKSFPTHSHLWILLLFLIFFTRLIFYFSTFIHFFRGISIKHFWDPDWIEPSAGPLLAELPVFLPVFLMMLLLALFWAIM